MQLATTTTRDPALAPEDDAFAWTPEQIALPSRLESPQNPQKQSPKHVSKSIELETAVTV
eukprot:1131379-Amphidinium_carterae.1